MTCIYTRHIYLDNASKAALCAHYTDDVCHENRIKDARDNLIMALSGCEAGTRAEAATGLLIELIENAITDSFDVDWKAEHAARNVLDALLDEVAPMPKQKDVDNNTAQPRVRVPAGQTPLNDDLNHPYLDVIKEGSAARDSGTVSPYHGHSLEHCLHATGWVQRSLRLALDAAELENATLKAAEATS